MAEVCQLVFNDVFAYDLSSNQDYLHKLAEVCQLVVDDYFFYDLSSNQEYLHKLAEVCQLVVGDYFFYDMSSNQEYLHTLAEKCSVNWYLTIMVVINCLRTRNARTYAEVCKLIFEDNGFMTCLRTRNICTQTEVCVLVFDDNGGYDLSSNEEYPHTSRAVLSGP